MSLERQLKQLSERDLEAWRGSPDVPTASFKPERFPPQEPPYSRKGKGVIDFVKDRRF